MTNTLQFIVTEENVKMRLDLFLLEKIEGKSRSYLQKAIEEGKVLVNQKTVKASYKLNLDDVIDFDYLDQEELNLIPEDLELKIIYQDEDLLVINKPRGMVVHPSNGHYNNGTLVHALLYHVKDLSSINGVIRPGIVHRIDKDTSGLLVVAKNDTAHIKLSEQLKDKTMHREYLALVEGVIPHGDLKIVAPLGKDKKNALKRAVDIYKGKEAVTHVKVLQRFNNYTLVTCRLETGRTHQIRVHLAYIKHPIVGDITYGFRKSVLTDKGQMLHAYRLSFVHPRTNKIMSFTCPIDDEFKNVLERIRLKNL